jgi:PDDEXK-like domain of unknown function (DUF3799)
MTAAAQQLYPDADGVLQPHPVGLVECTNDQYHSGPGISKSHLDAIATASPRHYWWKYLAPDRERQEPTAAMIMGTAVHSAILEPDLFTTEVIESPAFDRRTKVGKAEYEAFQQAHKGKIVLAPEDFAACLSIRDAVHAHPVASGLLRGGKAEQSFYAVDRETGELIKCRTDYLHDSGAMIVDVKTTEDASPSGFGKSAANFRYPIQTAWYNGVLDAAFGEHPQAWVFLAVEKKPPYAVGIYFMDAETLARAEIAARRDFLRIVEHRRAGEWPDYGMQPMPLALPGWSKL